MKIKINTIDGTVGSLWKIQKILRSQLSIEIQLNSDKNIIAFHSLNQFNFKSSKYSIGDLTSVSSTCEEILKKYLIYKNGKIEPYFKHSKLDDDYNPISHFIKYIVGFHKLPFEILLELEPLVKNDLKEILSLIKEYEQDPIIADYINGIKRGEHQTKTRVDFYNRCLIERNAIIDYLTTGIEKRVIYKACQNDRMTFLHSKWSEQYMDRPYKWWHPRSIELFDYKKINTCLHRLDPIPINRVNEFVQFYNQKKAKFYTQLNKYLTPKFIFHEIQSHYIPALPKVAERTRILDELNYLFHKRKWFGFTALALTQVEGIFSDMLHIMHPGKKFGSLSTKVYGVRPHYNFEEANLDYFEYCLPNLRNSFLHSGSIQDRDFKFISYDLLYDLHYLLVVFTELNDPHIELHKFLNKNPSDIELSLKLLNQIFELVKTAKDRYSKNKGNSDLLALLDSWDNFEENILAKSDNLKYHAENISLEINSKVDTLFEAIKVNGLYNGKELDIMSLSIEFINKNKTNIVTSLKEIAYRTSEYYTEVMDYYKFLSQYKKFLPHCPGHIQSLFDEAKRQYDMDFKKMHILEAAFEN